MAKNDDGFEIGQPIGDKELFEFLAKARTAKPKRSRLSKVVTDAPND